MVEWPHLRVKCRLGGPNGGLLKVASYAKSLCSDSGGGLGALPGGGRDQSLEEAGRSGWFGCGGGLEQRKEDGHPGVL